MAEKPIDQMSVPELQRALVIRVFEANLITRALSLTGEHVDVDLVERQNTAHPEGYTEIQVKSGEASYP